MEPWGNPSRPLRVGVVGMGYGAQVHVPGWQSLPQARVAAVADSGSGRVSLMSNRLDGVLVFHDWRALVASPRIDLVSVAAPPARQADIVCAAIAAGKHVLCEKPFGCSLADADRMWGAAQSTAPDPARQFAVGYQFRFDPGVAALYRWTREGSIGAVQGIQVTWLTAGRANPHRLWSWQHDAEQGGGVLAGFVSHVLDYCEWLTGEPIQSIRARTRITVPQRPTLDGKTRAVTGEDAADVWCETAHGISITLSVSNTCPTPLGHRVEVQGATGRLVLHQTPPFGAAQCRLLLSTAAGTRAIQLSDGGRHAAAGSPLETDSRMVAFAGLAAALTRAVAGDAVAGDSAAALPDFGQGRHIRALLDTARQDLVHETRKAS